MGDQDAECPLSQPLQHLDRLALDRVITLGHPSSSSRPQSPHDLFPQPVPARRGQIVTLALDDIPAEVLWSWDPVDLPPAEGTGQDDAAALVGRPRVGGGPSISLDAASHLEVRRRPVLLAKRVPADASFDQRRVGEKAPTDDRIVGIVKLEQQRLAGSAASSWSIPSS